ncbi:MAG: RluA family pseudouridine synthase [Gammaproteobacteria bacterium]|nr:RluA family pseudouridine synthase [Gammaproteobacteria bacterium]
MKSRQVTIVEVDAEQGQRLDNFLLARLKGLPRSRIYRMVRRGEVRVNGSRVRVGYRVQRGDQVRIPPYRQDAGREATAGHASRGAYEELLSTAVYHDDELIVLDKPSGMAVHGGSGVSFGVVETLRRFDPATPYELVHRIDRDTSGCLAVAKSRRALLAMHAEFRRGNVKKRYDLVVAGCWPSGLHTVDEPLERYVLASGERRVRVSRAGEPARTDFAVVEAQGNSTWLAAYPRTGRTHQIRVHAASSGHPILGDDKYAHGEAQAYSRLMLHASELTLTVRDKPMRFAAPLPEAFEALRKRGSPP